jgi:hypothetical protein
VADDDSVGVIETDDVDVRVAVDDGVSLCVCELVLVAVGVCVSDCVLVPD